MGTKRHAAALIGAMAIVAGSAAIGTTIAGAQTDVDAPTPEPGTEVPATGPGGAPAEGVAPPSTAPPAVDSPWTVASPSTVTDPTPRPSPPADAAASSSTGDGEVGAAAQPIDGWVADGDSGLPLAGICVALYSVEERDAFAGFTVTSGDGSWSFVPGVEGSYRIAYFRPTADGDCKSMPLAAGPVPEWAFDQALVVGDPTTASPPPGAATIPDGSTGIGACLGDAALHVGGCDRRFGGKGTISGTVTRPGPAPVAAACIYVLAQVGTETYGNGGMTDADGRFLVSGLVEGLDYVVAAVPPFEEDGVPCETEDGPPPPSGDGLQPEFYADVWIDLTAPELDGDVVGWAEAHGAAIVHTGATGVDVCLTPEAGDVEPRGVCGAAAPTDVVPADTTATGEAPAATAVTGTLPLTGGSPAVPAAVGASLVALGVGALIVARRRPA